MLPGAHRTVIRARGVVYVYWRAWRGRDAPLIGSFKGRNDEEVAALEKAAEPKIAEAYGAAKTTGHVPGFMASLIADYRKAAFPLLAPATQKVWRGHIDHIQEVFGETSLKAMQQKGARGLIKRWHLGVSLPDAKGVPTRARTANIRLTVLSRILSFGVDEELLERNAAAGIRRLDEGPGRASIIWTEAELAALLAQCSPHVARAVRLAALTGLRMADVVALNWSEVEEHAIVRPTSKSRRKQRASIPIYPALADLLAEFPKLGPKVVTNSRGRPWKSADAFDSSLRPALRACGVDKHFHDLRGTAATIMFRGGLEARAIALALGWSEREVQDRLNDYVDGAAAARAFGAIVQLGAPS